MPLFAPNGFPSADAGGFGGFNVGGAVTGILDVLAMREQRKAIQASARGAPPTPGGFMGRMTGVLGGPGARPGSVTLMAGRAVGAIRNAAGRIVGFITGAGKRISPKTAGSVAKKIGIEAAAVALGITAFELAEMLFDQAARPRRRRGLSYRDIRTARRVCRTISTMQSQLAACARPRSVRRLPGHGHRVVPT